jgi:hypothetical protein
MRRAYLALIVAAIVVFLAVSALLARVFSADGAERSAITGLVQAEARGDAGAMLRRMTGCASDAACRARVQASAAALRRAGSVSILQIQPSTGFSLSGTTGYARVAWKTSASLPIVQCVRVRRAGNAVSGIRIELLSLTQRLKGDATCP